MTIGEGVGKTDRIKIYITVKSLDEGYIMLIQRRCNLEPSSSRLIRDLYLYISTYKPHHNPTPTFDTGMPGFQAITRILGFYTTNLRPPAQQIPCQ